MAPKRRKREKARQVQHHLDPTPLSDDTTDGASVVSSDPLDADAVAGAADRDSDRVHEDAKASTTADPSTPKPVATSSEVTMTDASVEPPAQAHADDPGSLEEERTPALDVWPDFEEVVFPTPTDRAAMDAADPDAGQAALAPAPVIEGAEGDPVNADSDTLVDDESGDSDEDPVVRYTAPAPPATASPIEERRRADGRGTATVTHEPHDSWTHGVLPSASPEDSSDALADDGLDEDERVALRIEREVARERAAQSSSPAVEHPPTDIVDAELPQASPEPEPTTLWGRLRGWSLPGWLGTFRETPERVALRPAEVLAMLGAIALAIALWVPMMRQVRLENMSDLGLISALPTATVIPFALLLVSFGYCLWRAETKALLLGIHTIALVVMVYAIRALYVPVPSYKVAYRHIGVADAIDRLGKVDSTIDAYFNWPGFFSYTEGLAKAVGFDSIEPFVNLAPMVFNLLYLAPVIVILRTMTSDRRLMWIGVWAFVLGNWVAQDYLSPQGLAFFIHLVVIAIVLRWFTTARRGAGTPPASGAMAALAVLLVLMAYLIPSHQLTPYATVLALFAMLLLRRLTSRSLPVLVAVLSATWLVLMATSYLSGHQSNVTGSVGGLSDTVSSNVGSRVVGSADRVFVVQTRIVFSVGLWLLALIGAWRLFRRGRLDPVHLVIPASAFVLIPIQSYGGEVVFRVFLFALPFVAAFATVAIMPRREGRFGALGPVVAVGWLAVLLGTLVVTRYGNERMDVYTRDEIAATQFLYDAPGTRTAVRRSVLALGASDNLPWKAREYEIYQWKTFQQFEEWKAMLPSGYIDPQRIVAASQDLMRHYPEGAYLIFTRSQAAEIDLMGTAPRGTVQDVEAAVTRSPWFRRVFVNGNARIYELTPAGEEKQPQDGVGS